MSTIVRAYKRKFKKEHRNERKLKRSLILPSLALVVAVFWVLHFTGIAMTNEMFCGYDEAHTHSDSCYESVLTCGLEEGDTHTHDSECYEQVLVCAIPEHVHTVACLSEVTVTDADNLTVVIPEATQDGEGNSEAGTSTNGSEAEADGENKVGVDANTDADDADTEDNACITYTAEADDIVVTVMVPIGALPEEAELVVVRLEEDSEAYAEAADAIGLDEEKDMIALDIYFAVNGEEVEPTETVTVSIDASAALPEDIDAATVEVQHLEETHTGVEAVLVADAEDAAEGTVDTENVVAEFVVDSFSTFTISWTSGSQTRASITVTVMDTDGDEIEEEITSVSITSGTSQSLTDWEIDGYEFDHAEVVYTQQQMGSTTTTSTAGNATAISYTYSSDNMRSGYTITNDGSSINNVTSITSVTLYYRSLKPTVSLSATAGTDGSYTLTATPENFTATPTYEWTVTDNATLSDGANGSKILTWNDNLSSGAKAVVTVVATYTSDGGSVVETATTTETFTYGLHTVTLTVTYGSGSVASGANVALVDANGNIVASGTTNSSGVVELQVPDGDYTVEASYVSNSTAYGYEGTLEVTGDKSASISLSSASYGTYNHIDLRVTGTFELSIGEGAVSTVVDLTTYIYDGEAITVTLPDGSVVEGTADYSTSSDNGEIEYRYQNLSISSQWDGDYVDGSSGDSYLTGSFTLSGYVLISCEEVANSGLTEEQIANIFGSYACEYFSASSSVTAGDYYVITFDSYHPELNECTGTRSSSSSSGFGEGNQGQGSSSRGYDFGIAMNSLLTKLSDQLIVTKYVVDEDGNILSSDGDDSDDTAFTITLYTSDGMSVGSASLKSGESYTFTDIDPGYYYIEETKCDGYLPVQWDGDSKSWAETSYVQYVQDAEKLDETIYSLTFYNMKQTTKGVVNLTKTVNDYTAEKSYEKGTYTFSLYQMDDNDTLSIVSVGSDSAIKITGSNTVSFTLTAGTYYIAEEDVTVVKGDSWTMSLSGATAVTISGKTYYEFTVKVEEAVDIAVTNTFSNYTNVKVKKVDDDGKALAGAKFTLTRTLTDDTGEVTYYYNGIDDGGAADWTTAETVLTADSDGDDSDGSIFTISGLSDGTYTLKETTAPDGYRRLVDAIVFTVTDGTVTMVSPTSSDTSYSAVTLTENTFTVQNTQGTVLPHTGGSGTKWYTMMGIALMGAAACLMYKRLRRRKEAVL